VRLTLLGNDGGGGKGPLDRTTRGKEENLWGGRLDFHLPQKWRKRERGVNLGPSREKEEARASPKDRQKQERGGEGGEKQGVRSKGKRGNPVLRAELEKNAQGGGSTIRLRRGRGICLSKGGDQGISVEGKKKEGSLRFRAISGQLGGRGASISPSEKQRKKRVCIEGISSPCDYGTSGFIDLRIKRKEPRSSKSGGKEKRKKSFFSTEGVATDRPVREEGFPTKGEGEKKPIGTGALAERRIVLLWGEGNRFSLARRRKKMSVLFREGEGGGIRVLRRFSPRTKIVPGEGEKNPSRGRPTPK